MSNDEQRISDLIDGGMKKMNDIRVELEEPLKTEFENIFNASNWQNVQLKIN